MGIWIELGIFALALAFGLWQIHDVKRARERTRRERARQEPASDKAAEPPSQAGDSGAGPGR